MIFLLLAIGVYFWHLWKLIQVEEAFEKRYDEAERYWSDIRDTHRGDMKIAKERIAELESENADLRGDIEELESENADLRGDIEELESGRLKILEVLAKNSFGAVDTP